MKKTIHFLLYLLNAVALFLQGNFFLWSFNQGLQHGNYEFRWAAYGHVGEALGLTMLYVGPLVYLVSLIGLLLFGLMDKKLSWWQHGVLFLASAASQFLLGELAMIGGLLIVWFSFDRKITKPTREVLT